MSKPILLAINSIDERARKIIEQAGGRIELATTSTTSEHPMPMYTLLVKLPVCASLSEDPFYRNTHTVTVSFEDREIFLELSQYANLYDTKLTFDRENIYE